MPRCFDRQQPLPSDVTQLTGISYRSVAASRGPKQQSSTFRIGGLQRISVLARSRRAQPDELPTFVALRSDTPKEPAHLSSAESPPILKTHKPAQVVDL